MTYPHPLENDTHVVQCKLVDRVRETDRDATLAEIVLEASPSAKLAWNEFESSPDRVDAAADAMLLKSLLATADLHRRGIVSFLQDEAEPRLGDEDRELLDEARAPYEAKADLIRAYHLSPVEVRALEAYSLPHKSQKQIQRYDEMVPNGHYMGDAPHWGDFGDGWTALASAMAKIPNLGQLGLVLTTYRAPRVPTEEGAKTELELMAGLKIDMNIEHGTVVMEMGQRHYMSTAVTYNTHWGRVPEVGGLIAVTGGAGVYINPFGKQSFLDGGEVLYPPNFVTRFEGLKANAYREIPPAYPVAHLRQVEYNEYGQAAVDDSDFGLVKVRLLELDRKKTELVARLSQRYTAAQISGAMERSGLSERGIMYLTTDELLHVYNMLKAE